MRLGTVLAAVLGAVLAAALAAGCGVAVSPAIAPAACGRPVAPFELGAVHFLTRNVGVGLTTPAPRCGPMLAVSRDGGRHWLTEGTGLADDSGVEQVIATSTNDAWAAVGTGRLMRTTDAGSTWTTDTPRGRVLALALSGRTLWMLACLGGSSFSCVAVLAHKALPDGAWTISSPRIASGPYPDLFVPDQRTTLIAAGRRLLFVSDRGRRFTELPDPTWMGRPCQPAELAAAGRSWWLLCLGGAAAGSSEKALLRTTDGGKRWTVASQVTSLTTPPRPGAITLQEPDAMTAGSPRRMWLAALNSLYESGDAGGHWTRVRGPNPQGEPASFDVLSATHAWLLAAGQGLWLTTDGRHWRALGAVLNPR